MSYPFPWPISDRYVLWWVLCLLKISRHFFAPRGCGADASAACTEWLPIGKQKKVLLYRSHPPGLRPPLCAFSLTPCEEFKSLNALCRIKKQRTDVKTEANLANFFSRLKSYPLLVKSTASIVGTNNPLCVLFALKLSGNSGLLKAWCEIKKHKPRNMTNNCTAPFYI